MQKLKNLMTSTTGKLAAGTTALVVSGMALAQEAGDHTAAIEAAETAASTNVGAAVAAVIGIAAIVMGVGIVISLLRR